MEPYFTKAPKSLPLVFPRERKLYDSHIKCLYDNDTFSEILNEDYDSFVLNPWSWTTNGSATEVTSWFLPVVAVITIALNVLFMVTFIREKMLSANYLVLMAMGISDSLTVLIPSCASVFMYFDGTFPDYIPFEYCQVWGYLTKYLPTITHNASVWLTLVLAAQRYLIISKPFYARRFCVQRTSVSAIILVYVLAILSNLCRFIDTEYVPVTIVSTEVQPTRGYSVGAEKSSVINDYGMTVAETARICNESSKHIETCRAVYTDTFEKFGIWYEFFYYWFVILFVKFIPCLCLIILDTLMLRSLRNSEVFRQSVSVLAHDKTQGPRVGRRESKRMTIILVVVIIIVVIVELPIGVTLVLWTLNMIHAISTLTEETLSRMSKIANVVIYISYPIIFTLYCCMSVRFRRALLRRCCCRTGRLRLNSNTSSGI